MLGLRDMTGHPRFAEYVAAVESAGSDAPDVFGGTHGGGYHVQQNPREFAALLCYLMYHTMPIDLFCEIGTAAGGTLRLIREQIGFNNALVIDNGQHPKHRHFTQNVAAFNKSVTLLTGDSHGPGIAAALKLLGDDRINVALIDGDHSYEGVKQDIALIQPYCTPGTLLVFHDTAVCPGVKQAFEELAHPLANFVNTDSPFGIGVARNE